MTRKAVVLLGPPGAGKSTAGRLAAARLGLAFADLDEEIARVRGRPVEEVFREGEPVFRALELFALPPLLRAVDVVAAGGGVVDGARARALLAAGPCVLLEVRPETALERLRTAGAAPRPWFRGADLLSLYQRREAGRHAHRAALAVARISAEGTVEDVAARLAKALAVARAARGRAKPLAQSGGA